MIQYRTSTIDFRLIRFAIAVSCNKAIALSKYSAFAPKGMSQYPFSRNLFYSLIYRQMDTLTHAMKTVDRAGGWRTSIEYEDD